MKQSVIFTIVLNMTTLLIAGPIPTEQINSLLEIYTDKDQQLIKKDLGVVRSVCFDNKSPEKIKKYIATAGGPGARKSTTLEFFMQKNKSSDSFVYLDPDQRALKFMAHTYIAQGLSSLTASMAADYLDVIKNAYNKWRSGSNYIAQTLLNEAIDGGYSIAFGTTSTGAHVGGLFEQLKKQGYEITLLLCGATDATRVDAIRHRNTMQRFYQSSPEDAVNKGIAFAERMETYFQSVDVLELFWSEKKDSPITHAATIHNKQITLHDSAAYNSFVNQHNAYVATLSKEGKTIKEWDALLLSYSIKK